MRRAFVIAAAGLTLLLLSCRHKVPPAPVSPANQFGVWPDDNGTFGGITVSNRAGSVDLNQGFTAVTVAGPGQPPGKPFSINMAYTQLVFGAALNSLPQPEQSFLVYFELGKDTFTDASRLAFEQALAALKARASTDVSVVGHADTSGDQAANYQLALRRASQVADELTSRGVDPKIISVESHGDADLLIKTGRGVPEARNRRVEIIVR